MGGICSKRKKTEQTIVQEPLQQLQPPPPIRIPKVRISFAKTSRSVRPIKNMKIKKKSHTR